MSTLSSQGELRPVSTPGAPGSAGEPVVKCVGLTKTFRDFWLRNRVRAVEGVDFEIRRGEVFGLLGPNGSGKSTTIKMILGLLRPTAGRISVFGKRPDDVDTKKHIGYLPEESYLYRFLNARETLEYYARLFHLDRARRQKRIDQLLEQVGLVGVQRRPVGEYSKGMQRRIGLAQALINDPQFLILDEPTTGLDPIGTRQIKDLILHLAERGKTILLCSHLLADVEDVCDRVAIMFGGKVRRYGTVDELLTQSNRTTIETESLDVETVQQIENLLESRGKHIERVERPRQRLESLFLDIVQQAQAEGATTSGATAGGGLAAFLGSEGGPEAEGEAVIEKLVNAPATPPPAAAPTPVAAPVPQEKPAVIEQLVKTPVATPQTKPVVKPEVEEAVVSALIEPAKPAVAPPPAAPAKAATPAPAPKPAPAPVAPPKKKTGEEEPDQAFIQALMNVKPFEEGKEEKR